jgi:hypothetical protein
VVARLDGKSCHKGIVEIPPARSLTVDEQEAAYREFAIQSGLPPVLSVARYLWYCIDPEEYRALLGDQPPHPKPAVRVTSFLHVRPLLTAESELAVCQQAQMLHDFSAHHLCLTAELMKKARQVAADHLAWWRQVELSILANPSTAPASRLGARTGRFADLIDLFAEGRLSADELREGAEARELQRRKEGDPKAKFHYEDRTDVYNHLCGQLGDRDPELEARFRQEVTQRKRGPKPKN